ncbi:MAG: NUDIX hydrolase [Candidatus Jorgensenbacteria bacterium]
MEKTNMLETRVELMEHAAFLIIDTVEVGARILLIWPRQENGVSPLWKLPGGKRENYELPEETMVREVMEEVGLTISKTSCKCIMATLIEEPEHRFIVFSTCNLSITVERLRLNPDEISVAAFFNERQIEELIKNKLIPKRHAIAIQTYLQEYCYV